MGECGAPQLEEKDSELFKRVYPVCLSARESLLVWRRRARVTGEDPNRPERLGLALSGGGIRSATFCLGVLQAMAKNRLLRKVDFLSTVSGGGYIGSFLGALFVRPPESNPPSPQSKEPIAKVEAALKDPLSEPIEWLRENGRYLAPHGGGDWIVGVSIAIRNWAAVMIVMGLAALTLFLIADVIRIWLDPLVPGMLDYLQLPGLKTVFGYPVTDNSPSNTNMIPSEIFLWMSPGGFPFSTGFPWLLQARCLLTHSERLWWLSTYLLLVPVGLTLALVEAWSYWLVPCFRTSTKLFRSLTWLITYVALCTCAIIYSMRLYRLSIALDSWPTTVWPILLFITISFPCVLFWAPACLLPTYAIPFLQGILPLSPGLDSWLQALWFLLVFLTIIVACVAFMRCILGKNESYCPLRMANLVIAFGVFYFFCGKQNPLLRHVCYVISVTSAITFLCATFSFWWAQQKISNRKDDKGNGSDKAPPMNDVDKLAESVRWLQRHHSDWLGTFLVATVVLLAFGLIDSLGQSLYASLTSRQFGTMAKALVAGTGLAALSSWVTRFDFIRKLLPQNPNWRIPLSVVFNAAGLMVLAVFLIGLNLLAHAIFWQRHVPKVPYGSGAWWAVATAVVSLLLSCLVARSFQFINGSSLQLLYGSRMARAYLGASNPERYRPEGMAITTMIQGDDIWLKDYEPEARGGPLHLINMTFNETCSAKSQVEQRDRKGLPFAIGPAGLSVGRKDHATWRKKDIATRSIEIAPIPKPANSSQGSSDDFDMFPMPTPADTRWQRLLIWNTQDNAQAAQSRTVEALSVGHWIALSGAAVSTGMGSRTSLGLSLLTGLANFRLGYWWDSKVAPRQRENQTWPKLSQRCGRIFAWCFPVQSYLLDEWLARFHGPARRGWYLTDGGHFENTGVYELIRRRVSHIICCDCGEDPGYQLTDIANLVRKARTDFDAEITFLTREQLKDLKSKRVVPDAVFGALGTPEELSDKMRPKAPGDKKTPEQVAPENPQDKKTAQYHAMLATVRYERTDVASVILFIKPALSGDESEDVMEYKDAHPDFPNQSTVDQFFDEAQWESYRKLGEHSADQLFAPHGPNWFIGLTPEKLVIS